VPELLVNPMKNPCSVQGYEAPLAPDRLKALYRSKAEYLAKVAAWQDALIAERLIRAADREADIKRAGEDTIPD
jgi:hypothetical protein